MQRDILSQRNPYIDGRQLDWLSDWMSAPLRCSIAEGKTAGRETGPPVQSTRLQVGLA